MSQENIKVKKGFTIIEVVLVLAIAGLIFLMVFVALPALQRSQRDTQRRDDMARLITAVQNYMSNNRNRVPTTFAASADGKPSDFVNNYLLTNGDTFSDPSTGATYTFESSTTNCTSANDGCPQGSTNDDMGIIHVYTNATCDGESPKYINGANRLAFTINLEGAGIYCTNI
ncbi:type II secretion system protein [Candidatus Saccharibacteria bacterium]|nr:type II secretion system protein [Candidatus Saccharibacteria bacterium]